MNGWSLSFSFACWVSFGLGWVMRSWALWRQRERRALDRARKMHPSYVPPAHWRVVER